MSYVFCYSHGTAERLEASTYLQCFECKHCYQTKRELRRAYLRGYWQSRPFDEGSWRHVWFVRGLIKVLFIRADRIAFCQHCIHDFL
jgi:hypothetical protein